MAPVGKHAWVGFGDVGDSLPGFGWCTVQVFEFPSGPFDQMMVYLFSQEVDQQGFIEAPVVVDPAGHDAVDHRGDFGEAQVGASAQTPPADSTSHVLRGGLADRRDEPHCEASVSGADSAWPERVGQKGELRDRIGPGASILFAVHDPRFLRVEPQTKCQHPVSDHTPDEPGLFLAGAVDDDIVAVPFEPDLWLCCC